jgi:hypothetical protein
MIVKVIGSLSSKQNYINTRGRIIRSRELVLRRMK